MKKPILFLAAAWLAVSVSCWNLDNPGDPEAESYQGYETVATVAEVKPSSPADGATVIFPVLSCNSCVAADFYSLQIGSSTGDFTAPVYQIVGSSDRVFKPADAGLTEETYSWHVKARNKSKATWATEWSASARFTITGISSTGISPANTGTTSDTTPLLDWGDVTEAAKYQVQVATSAAGVTTATAAEVTVSQYQVPLTSAFAYGDTGYWRVRPVNADGVAGAWSASFSFSVAWTIDYGTISPANTGTTSDTTPLLDWGDVTEAAKYQVQVATSAAGVASATAVEVTASAYQMTSTLAIGDTRYWRVRPVNADGVAGGWSATWSFTVSILDMISVTGGTFQMGSTSGESDETPVHSVTVSSFMIGKHEVTQSQYQQVMASNPSNFTSGTDAPSRPVEKVTWYNAVSFCNALSALDGLNNVYTINGTTVSADFTKNGYRLPTEAEWEFAARGGTSSQGYTYSGSNTVDTVGWYSSNSGSTTHPVGTKAANELGIYDMSGNVWEWCWDWYGSYSSTAQTDPTGASSGSYRVLRGGSWIGDGSLRCASRGDGTPGSVDSRVGFRVARRQD